MFDLSYDKTLNKRRRGERGKKQRYSVFRANRNIRREQWYEQIVRDYAFNRGQNVEDFFIEDEKVPWRMTWEFIQIMGRRWPYCFGQFVTKVRFNPEEVAVLKKNVEIGDRLKAERGL